MLRPLAALDGPRMAHDVYRHSRRMPVAATSTIWAGSAEPTIKGEAWSHVKQTCTVSSTALKDDSQQTDLVLEITRENQYCEETTMS